MHGECEVRHRLRGRNQLRVERKSPVGQSRSGKRHPAKSVKSALYFFYQAKWVARKYYKKCKGRIRARACVCPAFAHDRHEFQFRFSYGLPNMIISSARHIFPKISGVSEQLVLRSVIVFKMAH